MSSYLIATLAAHAVLLWGEDAQLDIVQEECAELIQAISKLRRARRAVEARGPNLDTFEARAADRELSEAERNIVKEAADVWIMLQQLEALVSGEYQAAREFVVKNFAAKVTQASEK